MSVLLVFVYQLSELGRLHLVFVNKFHLAKSSFTPQVSGFCEYRIFRVIKLHRFQ